MQQLQCRVCVSAERVDDSNSRCVWCWPVQPVWLVVVCQLQRWLCVSDTCVTIADEHYMSTRSIQLVRVVVMQQL